MAVPAGRHESSQCELPGLRAAQGSLGTPPPGGGEETQRVVLDGNKDGGGTCSWLEA